MPNTKRQLALIVYKPGYGGSFLQQLFSLGPQMYQCNPEGVDMFRSLESVHFPWWRHHHGRPEWEQMIRDAVSTSCEYAVAKMHPFDFFGGNDYDPLLLRGWELPHEFNSYFSTPTIVHVTLNPNYEHLIEQFKISNGGFPILRPKENDMDAQISNSANVIIHLDRIMFDVDTTSSLSITE